MHVHATTLLTKVPNLPLLDLVSANASLSLQRLREIWYSSAVIASLSNECFSREKAMI